MAISDINVILLDRFCNELDEVIQNYLDLDTPPLLIVISKNDPENKDLHQLSSTLEMLLDDMKNIQLDEFEANIKGFVDEYLPLESAKRTKEIDEKSPKSEGGTINYGHQGASKKQEEIEAGYSLDFKSKKQQEVEADYSLDFKSKKQQEVEADYSLKHESKQQQEIEADYSLKHESKQQQEVEADYSLNHESRQQQEVEADYSLNHESRQQQEVEADYSLKHESKHQQEVEVDYSLNSHEDAKSTCNDLKLNPEEKEKKRIKDIDNIENETSSQYRKIKIKKVANLKIVKTDVFLRISPEKFIKIVNANEEDEIKKVCQKYQDKFFTYFYLTVDDYRYFIDDQTQVVKDLLNKMAMDAATKAMGTLVIHSGMQSKIKELGITESVVDDVKSVMDQSSKILEESKSLNSLFDKVMRGKNFISENSLMVSLVLGRIGDKISWMNSNAMEKLLMAAILHDSAIEDDELAKCTTLNDSSLTKEEKEIIKEHPFQAANIIRNSGLLLPDVDNIVEQHHEMPDGSGFPRGISSAQISPMSATFIVCEKLSRDYLCGKSIEEIKKDISENYNRGNFKAAVSAILDSF